MDVSFSNIFPPVAVPGRFDSGASGFAQAAPVMLDRAPPQTDTAGSGSSLPPPDAGISGTDETSNTPSSKLLDQAIKQVNDTFNQNGKDLYVSFENDKITGIQVIKIMEKKTNEIIRQMPPREMIAFAQSLEVPQGWRGQLILDKA